MDNYVIFDLETTGILDKDKGIYPEIVEIGATKYDKEGKVIGSFNKFIKPESYGHSKDPSSVYGWGGTAETAAAASHKISWDTANEFGENKQNVLDEFYKFTEDSRVGGFNNKGFDNHVVEYHGNGKPIGVGSFDVLDEAKKLRINASGNNTLPGLGKMVGVENLTPGDVAEGGLKEYIKKNGFESVGEHSAAYDVKATNRVLEVLNKVNKVTNGTMELEEALGDKGVRAFYLDPNTIEKNTFKFRVLAQDKNNVNSRRMLVEYAFSHENKEAMGHVMGSVIGDPGMEDMIKDYLNDENMDGKVKDKIRSDVGRLWPLDGSKKRVKGYSGNFVSDVVDSGVKKTAEEVNKNGGFAGGTKTGEAAEDLLKKEEELRRGLAAETAKSRRGGMIAVGALATIAAATVIGSAVSIARGSKDEKKDKMQEFDRHANSGSSSYMRI